MTTRLIIGLAAIGLVLGLSLGFAASPASAQAPTIAVVDMIKVTEGYDRYREARKELEGKKAQLQQIVDEEERSVLSLIEELEAVRATASQDEIARRRREVEQRDRELREFVATTNTQFRDELDTLQFRTRDEVETVIVMISKARGYALVLEKNMALFATDSLDVTPEVVAELNRLYRPLPAGSASSSARPAATAAAPGTGQAAPTAFPAPTSPQRGWPFRSTDR
jgi:Skp family chaperone for outer membrane proteins